LYIEAMVLVVLLKVEVAIAGEVWMTRKNVHEIEFLSVPGSNDRTALHPSNHSRGMPIIRCVCGAQILVVPDVKALNRAIENHLVDHVKLCTGKRGDNLAVGDLGQFLIGQIFSAASDQKSNGKLQSPSPPVS
jgi:hypothetical protein